MSDSSSTQWKALKSSPRKSNTTNTLQQTGSTAPESCSVLHYGRNTYSRSDAWLQRRLCVTAGEGQGGRGVIQEKPRAPVIDRAIVLRFLNCNTFSGSWCRQLKLHRNTSSEEKIPDTEERRSAGQKDERIKKSVYNSFQKGSAGHHRNDPLELRNTPLKRI